MKKDFLITDVDGTILDRMMIYCEVFADICTNYGANRKDAANHYLRTGGTPVDDQFGDFFLKAQPAFIEQLKKEFFARAEKVSANLFPFVEDTLCELNKKSVTIVAISGSNTENLKRILYNEFNLPITLIIGSDRIKKGDAHVEEILEIFNLKADELSARAVLMGDTREDMVLAKRHNIEAVGVLNTVSMEELKEGGADVIITEYSSLLHFFN